MGVPPAPNDRAVHAPVPAAMVHDPAPAVPPPSPPLPVTIAPLRRPSPPDIAPEPFNPTQPEQHEAPFGEDHMQGAGAAEQGRGEIVEDQRVQEPQRTRRRANP